jgi:hypothetical protein
MDKVRISIVIVNWKVRPLLEKCLNSVIADTTDFETEIFVVDNDSRDGTPEMVMAQYPQVNMIALSSNQGFAKANNIALKSARGKYLFLLNPDTEVEPGFFKIIVSYLEEHSEVGILGPLILNSDHSIQPSIRRFPKLLSQLLILFKIRNVLPNNKIFNHYFANDFDYNKEQDAEQIMGAAMVIRREAFEKLGFLDERFFVWFEEVDYCQRAKKKKIIIRYLPTASILHHSGTSFAKQKIMRKQVFFDFSLLRYFLKHRPIWESLIILLVIPINLLLTAIYAWVVKNYHKTS